MRGKLIIIDAPMPKYPYATKLAMDEPMFRSLLDNYFHRIVSMSKDRLLAIDTVGKHIEQYPNEFIVMAPGEPTYLLVLGMTDDYRRRIVYRIDLTNFDLKLQRGPDGLSFYIRSYPWGVWNEVPGGDDELLEVRPHHEPGAPALPDTPE